MLALCSMLSDTYYARFYASIIGGSLTKYIISVNTLCCIFNVLGTKNSGKSTVMKHLALLADDDPSEEYVYKLL